MQRCARPAPGHLPSWRRSGERGHRGRRKVSAKCDGGATDASGRRWWSWRTRGAIAGMLVLAVLGVTIGIDGSVVLSASLHVPLALAYTFGLRRAPSSALAATGLAVATTWTSVAATTAEYADERAFYALTNAVLWLLVLLGAAAVGSAVAARRRPAGVPADPVEKAHRFHHRPRPGG